MFIKLLNKSLTFLFFTLVLSNSAWANDRKNIVTEYPFSKQAFSKQATVSLAPLFFKPIDPSAPESPSTTTGTRTGSCFEGEMSPQLMAPTVFVGKTADSTPTFMWTLPEEAAVPVEFTLYALQPSGELAVHHSAELAYTPGLSQYELPAENALDANQPYLWQMVLHCNPNRPSQALVYEREIELIPYLTGALPSGSTVEQAMVWAEAGYWYDAIAALGTSEARNVAQMREALLNDLKLIEEEMTEMASEE